MKNAVYFSLVCCVLGIAGCGETTNPNALPPQAADVGFAEAVRGMVGEFKATESPGSLADSLLETLAQADGAASEQQKPIYSEMESVAKEIKTMSDSGAARDAIIKKAEELEQLAGKLPGGTPAAGN